MPRQLSEGWRQAGCQVHEFLYGTHMGRLWTRSGARQNGDVNARLLSLARQLKRENRLDLIFAVIYDDVLEEATAKGLRTLGVPLVNYHVDMVGQWYRVLRTARYFDRLACAQRVHWKPLERAGARPYFMPMAANPESEDGVSTRPEDRFNGVLYLGSPWSYRRQVLGDLARQKFPLRVYGHGWRTPPDQRPDSSKAQPFRKVLHDVSHYLLPRMREEGLRPLVHAAKGRLGNRYIERCSELLPTAVVIGVYREEDAGVLVRGASINLGFTQFHGSPGSKSEQRQVRLREFQIPMLGGFYLTQRCRELGEFYEEDVHIACWDSAAELSDKIGYYLQRPDARRRVAAEGQRHAMRRHTWASRFRALLEELGLSTRA